MQGALTTPLLVACAVLCIAGIAKLRSPSSAARALSSAGLRVGEAAVRVFAAAELAIGVWCLLAPGFVTGLAVAVVYAGFAALTIVLSRGRAACGCFGESEAPASLQQALLSGAFALIAGAAAASRPHGLGWVLGHGLPFTAVLLVGIAGATYATVIAYTELPRAWQSWSPR